MLVVGEGAHSKYVRRATPVRVQVSEALPGAGKSFFLMLRKCFRGFRSMCGSGFCVLSAEVRSRSWSVAGVRAEIRARNFTVVYDFFGESLF